MKKNLDDLKERPKEERSAVAGGIAVLVMVVLLLGWGLVFFKKLASGEPVETEWGPRTDTVNFDSFESAADELTNSYYNATEELQRLQDEAGRARARYLETQQQTDSGRNDTSLEVNTTANEEESSGFGF